MNLLIFGASITWGAWDEEGGWAQRIKLDCDKKAKESGYENYTKVFLLGIPGENSSSLLERFDTEVKARQEEDEETTILIEIGINDSQFILKDGKHRVSLEDYKMNLITLIEKSQKHNANLVFIGLTPVDKRVDPIPWKPEATYRLEFVKKYDKILQDVCKEFKIPYLEIMSKFDKNKLDELLTDGLHPSTPGHILIYEGVKNNEVF